MVSFDKNYLDIDQPEMHWIGVKILFLLYVEMVWWWRRINTFEAEDESWSFIVFLWIIWEYKCPINWFRNKGTNRFAPICRNRRKNWTRTNPSITWRLFWGRRFGLSCELFNELRKSHCYRSKLFLWYANKLKREERDLYY